MNDFEIKFDTPRFFEANNFSRLDKICGLYFIFLSKRNVNYPFADSKLIYIGMSERKTNSIASRLLNHFTGASGNVGLMNFRQVDQLKFTFLDFNTLNSFWSQRVEDLESYFIQDFVKKYGVYPICNNKTGFPDFDIISNRHLVIDWDYFTR